MSFADLESRVNAAAMRKLANASALLVGGATEFPVIFDRAHIDTGVGVSATFPVATALDSDIVGFASGTTELEINAVTYTVRDMQPDGTGMTLLVLETA